MYRLKYFLFLLLIINNSKITAQELKESEVPIEIANFFKAKYPNIYVYEWKTL